MSLLFSRFSLFSLGRGKTIKINMSIKKKKTIIVSFFPVLSLSLFTRTLFTPLFHSFTLGPLLPNKKKKL